MSASNFKLRYLSAFVLLLFLSSFCLFSCAEVEKNAHALLSELSEEWKISGTVYSSSLSEADKGYSTDELFVSLYMTPPSGIRDYAFILLSSPENNVELALFRCDSEYDAVYYMDVFRDRIRLVRSILGSDTEADVMRYSKWVAMCISQDSGRILASLRQLIK